MCEKIKRFIKDKKEGIITIVIVFGWVFFKFLLENMSNPFWGIGTTFESVKELERYIDNHSESFERIIEELQTLYEEQNEESIYIGSASFDEYETPQTDKFIKSHEVKDLLIERDDGSLKIQFNFHYELDDYSSWGLYYVEDGQPREYYKEENMYEEKGFWKEKTDYMIYETKQIEDKLYYFGFKGNEE